jgi:putative membrane protein
MKTFIKNTITLVVLSSIALSCAQQSSQTVDSGRDSVNQEDKNVNTANIEQSKSDSEFTLAAADGGMLEARLGDLALQKALSPEVKSFAQSMVTDHGKANEELKILASKSNLSIPTTLSATSQQKYDAIAQKDGEDFDRAYAEAMVTDHKETIENFYVEANKGSESEISEWAKAKIPILEHHLMMAKKMYDVVKKSE